eukprot:6967110-Prymnesium_polylepis.1
MLPPHATCLGGGGGKWEFLFEDGGNCGGGDPPLIFFVLYTRALKIHFSRPWGGYAPPPGVPLGPSQPASRNGSRHAGSV